MAVRKETGEYLSRRDEETGEILWDSDSKKAWKTRVYANALAVADKYGGEIVALAPQKA